MDEPYGLPHGPRDVIEIASSSCASAPSSSPSSSPSSAPVPASQSDADAPPSAHPSSERGLSRAPSRGAPQPPRDATGGAGGAGGAPFDVADRSPDGGESDLTLDDLLPSPSASDDFSSGSSFSSGSGGAGGSEDGGVPARKRPRSTDRRSASEVGDEAADGTDSEPEQKQRVGDGYDDDNDDGDVSTAGDGADEEEEVHAEDSVDDEGRDTHSSDEGPVASTAHADDADAEAVAPAQPRMLLDTDDTSSPSAPAAAAPATDAQSDADADDDDVPFAAAAAAAELERGPSLMREVFLDAKASAHKARLLEELYEKLGEDPASHDPVYTLPLGTPFPFVDDVTAKGPYKARTVGAGDARTVRWDPAEFTYNVLHVLIENTGTKLPAQQRWLREYRRPLTERSTALAVRRRAESKSEAFELDQWYWPKEKSAFVKANVPGKAGKAPLSATLATYKLLDQAVRRCRERDDAAFEYPVAPAARAIPEMEAQPAPAGAPRPAAPVAPAGAQPSTATAEKKAKAIPRKATPAPRNEAAATLQASAPINVMAKMPISKLHPPAPPAPAPAKNVAAVSATPGRKATPVSGPGTGPQARTNPKKAAGTTVKAAPAGKSPKVPAEGAAKRLHVKNVGGSARVLSSDDDDDGDENSAARLLRENRRKDAQERQPRAGGGLYGDIITRSTREAVAALVHWDEMLLHDLEKFL
jgi:hypothetical protein